MLGWILVFGLLLVLWLTPVLGPRNNWKANEARSGAKTAALIMLVGTILLYIIG